MTVIGLDDTDSREQGMCTTYAATLVADAVREVGGHVERRLLIRLNPAVKHKTRGNAALAIHTDVSPETAMELASSVVDRLAVGDDPRTSPGVVVADDDPTAVSESIQQFARDGVREFHTTDDAVKLAEAAGYRHRGWHGGRGRIGALAAVGAWAAFEEWTYERISYREFERCGTPRDVDVDSVFAAAEAAYPQAWDTVDTEEGQAVCVPNAPGPILYGIRGDDAESVERVAAAIESEPVERTALFLTNQGTDAHLRAGTLDSVEDGRAYRLDGRVYAEPETRAGGHVFVTLEGDESEGGETLPCVAFEPTKRFRNRVRALRTGDELTVCGEVSNGTLKLEKFAVRTLNRVERVVPDCPDCGSRMESAGRNQGYRCRDCKTTQAGKIEQYVDRDLEEGWYEVPPCARRHIAKPLVRGGFDTPTHPER
ncbi:tRNA(Ile2) 2-agmatinylcytidine synthetase [Haloprofundus marisrubri]|uniref:tRNA(Ile2) 2-agmatinylcytidine synthetase TiaS n=1 Tax=Haloprofundus marisrubri TaxID=1514971 RepID=A0A0W1RC68_9EURY|nr:tRNA(Ile)(2)-agmatinylcytidine synthase [Haloprofundus marisrubri]KTG11047.1 tRNA(Ile2) 2-agmatinylcytidine synthetase [Haloprofundus marisrubri]